MAAVMLCGGSDRAFAQARGDPGAPQAATGHWVLSETTSPVNYGPLVIATTLSRPDAEGMTILLSLACRNGQTELLITNADASNDRQPADGVIVIDQDHKQPVVQEHWKVSPARKGAALVGDVVRFLKSLPDPGELVVRTFDGQGIPHDARFRLDGLSAVREKLAAACRWPGAGAAPRQ